MSRIFQQVTIVGLGLIGGSLGMAIRRRRLAANVVGFSRRVSTLRTAKARGAIESGTTDPQRAVAEADLVVLATPVDAIVPQAMRLARFMKSGSILMDVGSTKAQIVRQLERALPSHVAFVGAHPLAGSEQRGIDVARADLFDHSLCIVTTTARTNRRALMMVARVWKSLGCRVIVMNPQQHDRLLASVSHLPHLIALSVMSATDPRAMEVAPRSFLDATRVAKSDPDLWDDIFLSNQKELLTALDRFDHQLHQLRRLLAQGQRTQLKRLLARAKSRRDALQESI